MAELLFVTEDHTETLSAGAEARLRAALDLGDDLTASFDHVISDADPAYTVYLDGKQIHPAPSPSSPPAKGVEGLQRLDTARHAVIKACLNLAAVEWGNGRETASGSMDLDFACDQLDEALDEYAQAHAAVSNPPTTKIEPPPVFAREPVTLPAKTARALLEELYTETNPASVDGWAPVVNQYVGGSWEANWMLVIRNQAGEHFLARYDDEHPWEGSTEAPFAPVMPVNTQVTKYEPIPAE